MTDYEDELVTSGTENSLGVRKRAGYVKILFFFPTHGSGRILKQCSWWKGAHLKKSKFSPILATHHGQRGVISNGKNYRGLMGQSSASKPCVVYMCACGVCTKTASGNVPCMWNKNLKKK